MKIVTGKKRRKRRTLIYGPHGVGKSTWAASWPKAVFVPTEDGADDIGVDRFAVCRDFGSFNSALSDLLTQDHAYSTCVVDSVDWAEPLIQAAVCQKHGKQHIEDFGYGKGYQYALDGWNFILRTLDCLLETKQMHIVLVAHARIIKFSDPSADSYDRYEPDLHRSISSRLQEWCDEVVFATYKLATIKREEGFGRERVRAIGGDRVLYTTEMPTHLAKRRVVLPDELPLDFAAYREAMLAAVGNGESGNIDGLVVDGSSKKGMKTDG